MENTLTGLFIKMINDLGMEKEMFFTKENNKYIPFNNRQLLMSVYSLIIFFQKLQLKEDDKVAIISENSVDWVVIDFACMFMKLISVPIYTSQSSSQIKFIFENSGSKICFVSNSLLLDKVIKIKEEFSDLNKIVILKNKDPERLINESVISFSEIFENEIKITEQDILKFLSELSAAISGNDVLTIIYTSGTTGIPKGVMLTHNNFYSNITACQKVLTINENDTFLSYLPYSHAYERTTGYYLAFFCGAKIYYAQSIDTLAGQLPEVHPTIVITVPRLIDKIYNKLFKSGEEMKDGFQKKMFLWAIGLSRNNNITKKNIKWKIADRLVYKKIRKKTGERIRYFVCGGGALNKSVGEFFDWIGITILEGYGMTETSPVITVNYPHNNKYGTVGKALSGVRIKLSEENEILVKGELVMKGYYKDEKSTNEIIKNEWLYTGDIGEIDDDGYLKITDRKKSLFKTSGGKYVAPSQVEDLLLSLNYVENVMVIGNGRMYITALIVPHKADLIAIANKNNISVKSYSELISDKAMIKHIQKDIDKVQADLANFEKIRKFTLLENSFSIEGGEITPTLKIKRKFVEDKFKNEIEKMYLKI